MIFEVLQYSLRKLGKEAVDPWGQRRDLGLSREPFVDSVAILCCRSEHDDLPRLRQDQPYDCDAVSKIPLSLGLQILLRFILTCHLHGEYGWCSVKASRVLADIILAPDTSINAPHIIAKHHSCLIGPHDKSSMGGRPLFEQENYVSDHGPLDISTWRHVQELPFHVFEATFDPRPALRFAGLKAGWLSHLHRELDRWP